MAPHSSTLAWKTPWMEEPGRLQAMGSLSRTRLSNFTFTFHFHALEKEMATHSSVRAWRIPGTGKPGGLPSVGLHRVGHDWSDLAVDGIEIWGRMDTCICIVGSLCCSPSLSQHCKKKKNCLLQRHKDILLWVFLVCLLSFLDLHSIWNLFLWIV